MVQSASDIQKQVTAAVATRSVFAVSKALGVGREQVARIVAGLPVRRGTALLVRENLPNLDAPNAALVNQVYKRPSAIGTGESLCSDAENTNATGSSRGAGDNTMGSSKVSQAALQINQEDEGVKVIVNRTEAPPTRATSKQMAAGLNMGRDPFEAFLDAWRVPFVVIARQRVYLVADVEEAIRRAGKIAPPVGKSKKTAPSPKMTADEIAEAAGLSLVKGGSK